MRSIHLKAGETAVNYVEPANGKDFSLEELQEFVGGHIEIVFFDDKTCMVCNEEGKLNGLPINLAATAIYQIKKDFEDMIMGDVLICDRKKIK